MRVLVRVCGALGGLLWVIRWVLDQRATDDVSGDITADLTYWAGAVLLAVALGGTCAAVASASAPWLRAFTGVAIVVLTACVLLLAHDAAGDSAVAVDGAVGVAATVLWTALLARRTARPRSGAHAR